MSQPILYQRYSADDAVAAFGAARADKLYCDNQFLILPGIVICLVTIADAEAGSSMPTPSRVVWQADRSEDDASRRRTSLPSDVIDVWDRRGTEPKRIRDHHVFLRPTADEPFIYAGPAHLASYGSLSGRLSAHFSLFEKLPRDIWLALGGYSGWFVEVNHQGREIDGDDLRAFNELVGELPRHEFSHLYMTRYEEDSLDVHTNPQRGWLMYLRSPGDSGMSSRDLEYLGSPESEDVFKCVCEIDLEFPSSHTLPRELALRAAVEFFQTGQLPRCVHWEED